MSIRIGLHIPTEAQGWASAILITAICFFGSSHLPLKAQEAVDASTASLRLRFRDAPIDEVLSYVCEAAGFALVYEAKPTGKVDLWAAQPVSLQEAMELVNATLLHNGYAAIRKGRTLIVVPADQAKLRGLPVSYGADPKRIPTTSQLQTQVVPVKFVEVVQLLKTLQPLAPSSAVITANESANTLVISDTQENIHRLVQIIEGIDIGAETFTVVKVLHLRNAKPDEMAELISELFPDESRSQGSSGSAALRNLPGSGGGFGDNAPGMGAMPGMNNTGSATGATQSRRLSNRAKVVAVADQRTQSLVVTAARGLMPHVEAVVNQLDSDLTGRKNLSVFSTKNASSRSLVKVLQDAFEKQGSATSQANANQADVLENRSTTQGQQNLSSANSAGRGFGGGAGSSGAGSGGGGNGGP